MSSSKKKGVIIIIGLIIAIVGVYYLLQLAHFRENEENRPFINIAQKVLFVDIVDTPQLRQKGLSGRGSLREDEGMLFIFEEASSRSFWMKDMNFSIDIIWIDIEGVITGIEKSVSPDTYPENFSSGSDVLYVLEVNAGWTDTYNIQIGDNIDMTGLDK